ncbi:MAG: S8 family serine peptidase, partial [Candidatus Omnitrophica bacterium]|nr:S8 family serine peptidase [Candidatus Omnitrophota bacterium]
VTYTYYETTGNLESKKLVSADEDGNVYYHYKDEKFYDNGTADDDTDDYGRVDVQVLAEEDSDGAKAYENKYFAGTDKVAMKECYKLVNLSDASAPVTDTLLVTYTYYDTGCLESKTMPVADMYGNTYYHYMNEKFYNNGTVGDDSDDYGRVDIMVGSTYLEAYTYYASGSGRVQYKSQYKNINGIWYWYRAGEYANAGDMPFGVWIGGVSRETAGASLILSLPDKPEVSELDSLKLNGMIMPENTQDENKFYEKLEELKNSSDGKGAVIALLDSGIDRDILDIDISGGYDFAGENCFDGLTDSDYSDSIGHGTSVAGIIKGSNGEGIAPEADILAMKVFDDDGKTTSGIIGEAICYAVDKGAKILAMPFSLFPVSTSLETAIDYAYSKGAVLLAAGGNDGSRILENSLAAQEKVITIGSCDADGNVSSWSNTGSELDLLAPWDVVSFSDGDKKEAGTSFSVAFVAGVTALILSENPDMTQEEVLEELKFFTKDIVPKKSIKTKLDRPRGADVDEVVSMHNAFRMNRAQFTGHSLVENIPDVGIKK